VDTDQALTHPAVAGVRSFRKKPITVAAIQWTGDNLDEIVDFTCGLFRRAATLELTAEVFDVLHDTWVGVRTGQWIIRGVKGEFYPCDAEVLDATYDEVPTDGH
jgi:hypothetical protein